MARTIAYGDACPGLKGNRTLDHASSNILRFSRFTTSW